MRGSVAGYLPVDRETSAHQEFSAASRSRHRPRNVALPEPLSREFGAVELLLQPGTATIGVAELGDEIVDVACTITACSE